MSGLARKHNALNLSQGFPNFEPDPELIDLIGKALKEGYNQYAPMAGIFSLRKVIAEKIEMLYGHSYRPDTEVTITAGATQAIYTAITAFVKTGDEVVVFKPAYDCYEPAILASGGVPVFLQMKGKDFKIDWQEFRDKLTPKTRMVVINTPHNPSGVIFSSEDLLQLQEALNSTNCIVLSDEVYEHIVFDGMQHESVSRYPGLAARSIVCASFGKTFHATGWKMGYCVAPEKLMREFQKIHEFNVYCINHPFQRALAEYLKQADKYLELGPFFQEKRDFFLRAIGPSRFKFTPAKGTYFQILDFSEITDEGDVAFAKRLTEEYRLASIPISAFNSRGEDNRQLRFCFAKTAETLEKAAEIINRI